MIFIVIIFTIAFLLEGIGTLVSVIGLTQLFSFDWIIISLATSFDLAKIAVVSFLYREWNDMPKLLKTYMTTAAGVLMLITSAGAAGYLSSSFQKAVLPVKMAEIRVKSIAEEKSKLEFRKKEIDNQIANLPSDMVKGRTKLIANFKSETDTINNRLSQLDQELPKVQSELVDKNSHAGPITYLAEALSVSSEKAMGYIVALIIFVFDPLAISLILAGNYLISRRSLISNNDHQKPEDNDISLQQNFWNDYDVKEIYKKPIEEDVLQDEVEQITKEEPEIVDNKEVIVNEPKEEQKIKETLYEPSLASINATKADVEHIGLQSIGGMNKFYNR